LTRRLVDPGAFIPAATSGSAAQTAAIVTLADFQQSPRAGRGPLNWKPHSSPPINLPGVAVEGLTGRTFEGKITRFSYALDDASKTMLAEIELPNPKAELRPGMYARVTIGIQRKEDALLVPLEAVVVERAGTSVFTASDNKARKVPVKTGFNDGSNVEILSGVDANQPIILVGKRTLTDGQAVSVIERR